MKRALVVTLVLSCGFCASAQARSVDRPASRPHAHVSISIPPFLERLARNWAENAAKKFGKKAAISATTYVVSGGTKCTFPLPARFCAARRQQSRPRPWGLGMAVRAANGRVPGVWTRPSSPRSLFGSSLVPGVVYWLTCWTAGERIAGPLGSTNLWYRLTNGGYVSDAWLDTGTNSVYPGVVHC